MNRAGPRYLYWAVFAGGDPKRPRRVNFDIASYATGFYTRYQGDRAIGLLRYDWWADDGRPRGGSLRDDGRWQVSELPTRNVWLGSDNGEPVTPDEAARIVVELGHSPDVLQDDSLLSVPPS